MPSIAEAKQLLLAHMPPGAAKWMSFENGSVSSMWSAVAQATKAYGFDALDALRRETKGLRLVDRLPDWEAILRIPVNTLRSLDQRRAQVIARRREFGASTLPNIQGAAVPIASATTLIVEHNRTALDSLLSGTFGPVTVGAGNTGQAHCTMHDNAAASDAGLRFRCSFSGGTEGAIVLTITAPDGTQKSWQSQIDTSSAEFVLFGKEFAGCQILGVWTLEIDNTAGSADAELDAPNALFIDGIGRTNGVDGLGSRIFEWSISVDEGALTTSGTYEREALSSVAARWNPSHCLGGIALVQSDGNQTALADNEYAIADMCVCSA
jgi:hypothetical protein